MTDGNGSQLDVRTSPTDRERPCDGVHPITGQRCVLGSHKGYHLSGDDARWLDD